ncbi:MAG: hypothetical protein ABIN58_06105 [candidate division WOR-3 bacterium]
MTQLEVILVGVIVGLLGLAGGVKLGATGKVDVSDCSERHSQYDALVQARLEAIESLMKQQFDLLMYEIRRLNGANKGGPR